MNKASFVENDVQPLRDQLRRVGQEHLLAFWDELSPPEQRRLHSQIAAADVPRFVQQVVQPALARLNNQPGADNEEIDWAALAARAKPPHAYRYDGSGGRCTPAEAERRGEQALRDGKLAMILVAGGQGARLGLNHPKGMFPIGPVSQRTLFQVIIDRLRAVARRFGAPIPLLLMTSPATHDETVAFLAEHDRFGLPPDDLHFFCQGVAPAVDAATGKLLLAEKDSLFLAPDGHGGMLAALDESGCLRAAQARGIEHFFYGQVDNPLVQVCDPRLVGYHLLEESQMTTQVVQKAHALERVGNVVSIDGRLRIIEYSDLPEDAAKRAGANGQPQLWAGNIAVHVFEAAFLSQMAKRSDALPWHVARKPAPHLDENGVRVNPNDSSPNALKFERFIFDLLPYAENSIAVEAAKAEAFAPVKNPDTAAADTPAGARAAMIAQDTALLRTAGAVVDDGAAVEINPLFAASAEELARKIDADLHVTSDRYFNE